MAKKSMLEREKRRSQLATRLAGRRKLLKSQVIDPELDEEARWQAMLDLQKLPRDSSVSRHRNRCALTGRPRGFYRRFGLGRNCLREVFSRGEAPGVTRASW
ncbi:MAG TPA: 30S ribosomal protein S14 [Gammaproteobacteria bacterium]|nr:30S ribosomal protein S14 [Gammaproteobacteria bacterium]